MRLISRESYGNIFRVIVGYARMSKDICRSGFPTIGDVTPTLENQIKPNEQEHGILNGH